MASFRSLSSIVFIIATSTTNGISESVQQQEYQANIDNLNDHSIVDENVPNYYDIPGTIESRAIDPSLSNINIRDYISDNELLHYESIRIDDINRIKTINAIREHFTKEEILSFAETKRIRREMRDISYSQWIKIANAMNVMKFTSQSEGIRKYGNKFQNFDYMTCYHAQAAWQEIGNQNHFSPSFVTWHRAFELMFEESLIAIDPTIESVPYWDFRRDILDPINSIIFSDLYLGELMGDTKNGFGIINGPFKYWPIGSGKLAGPDCLKVSNMFGQMRNPVDRERSPYVTRMGGAMCGMHNNFLGTLDEWDECLDTDLYTDINSFQDCWENTFHYAAHAFVGGTRNPNITYGIDGSSAKDSSDNSDTSKNNVDHIFESDETWDFFSDLDSRCYTWSASTEVSSIDDKSTIYKFYAHPVNMCFDCHKDCSIDDTSYVCNSCHLIPEDGTCYVIEGKDSSDTTAYSYSLNDENNEYIWGDMLDAISSPNDPFFMFHHINLDRYTYIWQLINYDSQPYYNYPDSGWAQGINLNDTACYEHPLKNLFDMYDEDVPLSHRDIFDATTFETSPYIYDDILEGLLASFEQDDDDDNDDDNDESEIKNKNVNVNVNVNEQQEEQQMKANVNVNENVNEHEIEQVELLDKLDETVKNNNSNDKTSRNYFGTNETVYLCMIIFFIVMIGFSFVMDINVLFCCLHNKRKQNIANNSHTDGTSIGYGSV